MNSSSDPVVEPEQKAVSDERYQLPTFEQWFHAKLRERKDAPFKFDELILHVLTNVLQKIQIILQNISKDHNGLVVNESEKEFESVQQEYSYWYSKLLLTRSFMMQYYDVRPPNWATEILPEKMYVGCLLSEEDYANFVTKSGRIFKLKTTGVKDYEESLQKESSSVLASAKKEDEEEEEPKPEDA